MLTTCLARLSSTQTHGHGLTMRRGRRNQRVILGTPSPFPLWFLSVTALLAKQRLIVDIFIFPEYRVFFIVPAVFIFTVLLFLLQAGKAQRGEAWQVLHVAASCPSRAGGAYQCSPTACTPKEDGLCFCFIACSLLSSHVEKQYWSQDTGILRYVLKLSI